jgi:hypothetical protein
MIQSKKWSRIPDRVQNAYSTLKKRRGGHTSLSPGNIIRLKLSPVPKSQLEIIEPEFRPNINNNIRLQPESDEDSLETGIIKDQISYIIQSSLKKYPNLAQNIKKLETEKIACKCSIFSKESFGLDRVYAFSSIPCASEYCINRIIEDAPLQTFIKPTEYYCLISDKKPSPVIDKNLILYEKRVENIKKAVIYYKNHEELEKDYEKAYSKYVKPPELFNIPRHPNRLSNFSIPKPKAIPGALHLI